MRKLTVAVVLLIAMFVSGQMLAQTSDATLGGTVMDSSGAVLPGVSITARNTQTGIVSQGTSNSVGVYQFPSIPTGTYEVTAELQGFQRTGFKDVVLQVAARVRLNFTLQIASLEQSVEVSAALDSPLAMATPSVGGVITGQRVQDFPLTARSALDLVGTEAGVVGNDLAGGRAGSLNVTRDGVSVTPGRMDSGTNTGLFTSVDLVDEVRVIVAPADAELGRGDGQVQISTKSGTNQFHGSLFEAVRNTSLTANTWFNNQRGAKRDVLKRNQFGGRLGGPIIKNKTFFFFLYDAQRQRTESQYTATVFTSMARQGIFRFYPGVRNGNANSSIPTIDASGNPVKPASATGDLQSFSVFGRDPVRPVMDPSGTIKALLGQMPLPNDFRSAGDGLNTAGYTWARPAKSDRNQYNIRIDHNFNANHRLNASYTYEKTAGIFNAAAYPGMPAGPSGAPSWFATVGLTSTLSPTLVNDVRIGAQHPRSSNVDAWMVDSSVLPQKGQPFKYTPTLVTAPYPHTNTAFGNATPIYSISDATTWMRGRHAFKGGVEYRFTNTNGFDAPGIVGNASFGPGGVAVTGISSALIPGLGANESTAQNMLIDLSGSLSSVSQGFNVASSSNPAFVSGVTKQRDWHQREMSLFFKDDFKANENWTFNLGVRWEYYSVPWEKHGLATGPVGGGTGLFGISGTGWADLYQPGRLNGKLTSQQFIGKNSATPENQFYKDDWNNFGPAVGLSWSIPYFGKGKTVFRAGYSINYPKLSLLSFDDVGGYGLVANSVLQPATYLDISRMQLPLALPGKPLQVLPFTDRTQMIRAFDYDFARPYIQSWNVTLQRELASKLSLEVRYVGTKGTKLIRGTNVNEVNIFENGILDAFLITQAGGNSPLLDSIFQGLNLGLGAVNGTTVTGSASARQNSTTRGFFANNNVGGFANYLNTTTALTGVAGGLLRRAGLPENFVVANPQYTSSPSANLQQGAADFFGNFANSTYHALQVQLVKRLSNSWTVTGNYTFSKTLGEGAPAGDRVGYDPYRNGRDRKSGKRIEDFNRMHMLKSSGTYELPFGPGKKLFSGGSGFLNRLLERWQFAWIFSSTSGSPITIASSASTFNQMVNNTATLVGDFSKVKGSVERTGNGVVYFSQLKQTKDPAIANLTSQQGLGGSSTMLGITDSSGNLIFVNPTPGKLGTLALNSLEGPGQMNIDINLVKRVRVREGQEFEFRIDAISALNHPLFGNPNTDMNSTNFGRITSASGNRVVVLNLRYSF